MVEHWQFDQGRDVVAITTRQIMRDGHPVLSVIHYSEDQSWAFLSGHTFDPADALAVRMQTVVDTDNTLHTIADLPPGWVATRQSVGGEWHRHRDTEA